MNYIAISEDRYSTTKLTFKRATPKSDYVRILQLCIEKPTTLREMYPNTKAPFADEVVALAKQGYLQKYTTEKHIHYSDKYFGWSKSNPWFSKVWYQTTEKGKSLLKEIYDQS